MPHTDGAQAGVSLRASGDAEETHREQGTEGEGRGGDAIFLLLTCIAPSIIARNLLQCIAAGVISYTVIISIFITF